MEFDWKPSRFRVPRHIRSSYPSYGEYAAFREDPFEGRTREEIKLKTTEPNYTSDDVKAAKLLVDLNVREFILRLAQLGKMISKDAINHVKKRETLQHLLSFDLMTEEYLLTCRQDQHTICVVPSKDRLTEKSMASLRCSVCERSFPEENLEIIFTLTDRGKRLLDGSLWMSVWITQLLKESGVKKETIKWRLEAAGEELDILVEDFDSSLFLELKSREFGLGDAYPFTYRISRYRGTFGLVATMDKVSTDAKKFFAGETRQRGYPTHIEYLEGSKNIQKGIPKIVKAMAFSQVRRVVQPFSARIGFDLWPIVEHWLSTKAK